MAALALLDLASPKRDSLITSALAQGAAPSWFASGGASPTLSRPRSTPEPRPVVPLVVSWWVIVDRELNLGGDEQADVHTARGVAAAELAERSRALSRDNVDLHLS